MFFLRYSVRNKFFFFALILINIDKISTVTDPIYLKIIEELQQRENQLKEDQQQLKLEKKAFEDEKEITRNIDETDVIHLNIGGEILATTRQTLMLLPKSLFSILFNGRWEQRLHIDDDGNIFFDFNPIVFWYLLDQLQLSEGKSISSPSDPLLARSFEKMMKKLRLENVLATSNKNILAINVDGEIITTPISNSSILVNKTHLFIDNHPKLFRHLIKIQRQNKSLKLACQNILFSRRETFSPRKLFQNWKIFCGKLKSSLIHSKWNQSAVTIAGGNGHGQQLNQLSWPHGIDIDDDGTIVIADLNNDRIGEWRKGALQSQIVAGGNGQLIHPPDVIIDHHNDELIIAEWSNQRITRWSRRHNQTSRIIISNVRCTGLAMNNNGDIYVADEDKHEVRRWKAQGGDEGTVVAGGNGKGDRLNQLYRPRYIFVDDNESVYVSEWGNHRVTKWIKGAKEGIIVAGGQGHGNSLTQLNLPEEVFVDVFETIYIADRGNHRIVRWLKGSKQSEVVVGGNGEGSQSNQFSGPINFVFDKENNLYVTDSQNHRVQKFSIIKNK